MEEEEEGLRRSDRPPPSAAQPLATDKLDVTSVSTPGSHATDTSAVAHPASSASRAARATVAVSVGHDAIVPRQSSVAQPEPASLLAERALEVSVPPPRRWALVCVVAVAVVAALALVLFPGLS